jgi:hypothetical protein
MAVRRGRQYSVHVMLGGEGYWIRFSTRFCKEKCLKG